MSQGLGSMLSRRFPLISTQWGSLLCFSLKTVQRDLLTCSGLLGGQEPAPFSTVPLLRKAYPEALPARWPTKLSFSLIAPWLQTCTGLSLSCPHPNPHLLAPAAYFPDCDTVCDSNSLEADSRQVNVPKALPGSFQLPESPKLAECIWDSH